MKFEEALKCMRKGKKVKRPCYDVVYVISHNEIRYRHTFGQGEVYEFGLTAIQKEDIMAEDWEVVEDDNK